LLAILGSLGAKAQHAGKIDKFEISPEYLEGGKIKVSSGTTTTIKYKVTFVRESSETYPKFVWKPFNMTIRLSTPNADGQIVLFETAVNITNADFPTDKYFLTDKEFSATLENYKLNPNRPIILSYTLNGAANPVYSYDGKVYYPKITGTTEPSVDPELTPIYLLSWYDGGNMYRIAPDVEPNQRFGGVAFYVKPSAGYYYSEYRRDNVSGYPRYDYSYNENGGAGGPWVRNPADIGFRAFAAKQFGTVPVYKYANEKGKNIFYSTDQFISEGGRFKSLGIAFYAYPGPIRPTPTGQRPQVPGRPIRATNIDFDITPNQWVANPDGSLSFNLDEILATPTTIEILNVVIFGDLIPIDPNNPRPTRPGERETLIFPATYQGNSFTKEVVNGSIYIVCRNASNVAPTATLNFSLAY
jgi:hypothetical protein